ncbi:MAG: hypothetical protein PHE67_01480 [Campylobacterales bacterium]|nr:hypothetical protein [Campylobacterales bacterium]
MFKKTTLILAFALAFGGCASYNAFDMFKKDEGYEKALLNTKNAQLSNSFETKIKLTATYLNPLFPQTYKDAEYFFVGVFIPQDYDDSNKAGLFNKDYNLTIKTKEIKESTLGAPLKPAQYLPAVKIEEIVKKDESELYKKMPHVDNWSRYYVVSFPKQEGNEAVTLKLQSAIFGESLVVFPRVGLE